MDQSGFLGMFILWQTGKEIFGIRAVHLDPLRVNSYLIVEFAVFWGAHHPFVLLNFWGPIWISSKYVVTPLTWQDISLAT